MAENLFSNNYEMPQQDWDSYLKGQVSPKVKEGMDSWDWRRQVTTSDYSSSSRGTPSPTSSPSSSPPNEFKLRRGRPKSEAITNLILNGSRSSSTIKCPFCSRIFPRHKSLNAHVRTHTGERPYRCPHADCEKSFAQSGQLKTHTRLHTGEKPFVCSISGCESRYTHANRHCVLHPYAPLERCSDSNQCKANSENKAKTVVRYAGKCKTQIEYKLTKNTAEKLIVNETNVGLNSDKHIWPTEDGEYAAAHALLELAAWKA